MKVKWSIVLCKSCLKAYLYLFYCILLFLSVLLVFSFNTKVGTEHLFLFYVSLFSYYSISILSLYLRSMYQLLVCRNHLMQKERQQRKLRYSTNYHFIHSTFVWFSYGFRFSNHAQSFIGTKFKSRNFLNKILSLHLFLAL